jgi:rare lipoprotein A
MRVHPRSLYACFLGALLIAGCSTTQKPPPAHGGGGTPAPVRGGGYYQDDGPAAETPANLDRVPDAVPRVEAYASGPNKPYSVFGHEYTPDTSDRPFSERGIGSWYGRKFNGQRTSSGEIYDMFAMTAAHPTLPIPSYARVTNPANGRSVIVRINDRGPFHPGRVIDLSYAAAYKLGYIGSGSAQVEVERILPSDIRAGRIPNALPASPPLQYASATPAPLPAAPAAQTATAIAEPVFVATAPLAAASTIAPEAVRATPNLYSELPPDLMPDEVSLTSAAPSGSADSGIVAASGGAVYLQLAAFRVKTGADEFVLHLQSELEPALAQRLHVMSTENLYRVQLGPYNARIDASAAAQRLRDDLGIEPIFVTPR